MSSAPTNQITDVETLTLGELLYADPAITLVSEREWVAVVRAIASGDQLALRLLYEKALPVVSSYLMRFTGDRDLTAMLVLDVFETVWCEAPVFATADGPVLGWIMRKARALALNRADSGRSSHGEPSRVGRALPKDAVAVGAGGERDPEKLTLHVALEALTIEERRAIEATFLHGLSYAEIGAQYGQPAGTIKRRIRSGLEKLRHALPVRGEEK